LKASAVVAGFVVAIVEGHYTPALTEVARWGRDVVVDTAEAALENVDIAVTVGTLEIDHIVGHTVVAEEFVDTLARMAAAGIVVVVVMVVDMVAAPVVFADASLPDLLGRDRETRTSGGESPRGPESDYLAALRRVLRVYRRCDNYSGLVF
jgi:hypothetical protein